MSTCNVYWILHILVPVKVGELCEIPDILVPVKVAELCEIPDIYFILKNSCIQLSHSILSIAKVRSTESFEYYVITAQGFLNDYASLISMQ